MEDAYLITGGKKLSGEVKLSGAKNVALKTIIAALLFDDDVILKNIPKINDVKELLHLIRLLGAKAEFIEANTLRINCNGLNSNRVDLLHGSKIRVSFMLFAPLLHRFGDCYIPNPGGCRLGARPIDRIVEGMRKLGIITEYDHQSGFYRSSMPKKPEGNYDFYKTSHTGTELLIMLAVFGQGQIIIRNAALEPEIDDLINFLNRAGAKIKRQKSNIVIEGVNALKQKEAYRIGCDRNEAVTYASMALSTKGDIALGPLKEEYLTSFLQSVKKAGGGVEKLNGDYWRFYYSHELNAVDIETLPHPGFMTDWQPPWAVMMTQARGESIIIERIYNNRFAYVNELNKLGAGIEFIHREIPNPEKYFHFHFDKNGLYNQVIKITGPQKLHNGVLQIADLRAGATLAIGALVARGDSTVSGASILERGYENFVEKVKFLGGEIKKI